MATRYVRSTDGNNADDCSTWALAKADLAGVAAIDTAGDRIWVSQAHAESTAAAIALAFAGTVAAPTQLLCGNDAAEPPTALATSATISTTGASNIGIQGNLYAYGLQWIAGSAANTASINWTASAAGQRQKYEACDFILGGANGGSGFNATQASYYEFLNCRFKFSATGQRFSPAGSVRISGGSIISGGTTPVAFFGNGNGARCEVVVDGFDFSNFTSGVHLMGSAGSGRIVFRNCKLPASWSGSLFSTTPTEASIRGEMWNCDNASTNYRLWVEDAYGSIKHETTLVKTGGASDGTTPLAWKMASSANASFPLPLVSPEIASAWIDSTGSAKTITIEILRDSATALKDDEIWAEVTYLSDSGSPKASIATDAMTDILASAADQATSTATWTTTGMANPNKQKLEVTFTPQQKGVAVVKVCLAKPSTTVYIDPVAQVSDVTTTAAYQVLGAGQVGVAGGSGGGLLTHPGMAGGMRG